MVYANQKSVKNELFLVALKQFCKNTENLLCGTYDKESHYFEPIHEFFTLPVSDTDYFIYADMLEQKHYHYDEDL